ncbi:nectin-1-like [Sinocyclocheilus rhinocerous]|uniref:nectin-1-like n=1 Tax=Sinocyclocheilus rhinocerous TaxID=307959 RepID=UPI0007BA277F|nr:PREDICTED: nectin-1-like [Sinocyclocheilus rhinocerous]
MAGKTGEHAYVGIASGEAGEETIDTMEIEVSSAKDVRQKTMPHTPLKSPGPKRVKAVQEKDEISTSVLYAAIQSLSRKFDENSEYIRAFEFQLKENTDATVKISESLDANTMALKGVKEDVDNLKSQIVPHSPEQLQNTVDTVHRLGKKVKGARPRQIIIQFGMRIVRDMVWRMSKNAPVCMERKIRFREDFCKDDREAHVRLWPKVEEARKKNVKAYLRDGYAVINGVSGAGWGVSYSPSHICALKNSSVIMSCTYTYPTGHQIMKVFWTKTNVREKEEEFPDLSEDPEYSQRLQYLGDKQQNCTIRLSHVTQKDEHMYCFRFITDKPDQKWIGNPGVNLTVTDRPKSVSVSISPSGEIVEGDSVTLSCSSDSNPPAEISWFKKRKFVGSGRIYSISNISSDHSGEYKCKSINEHGEKYSAAVTLNVMYPPNNVSVSINGSGEIVEGDSVTLSCSSDSNPPALNFSWFKENQSSAVGSGQSFSALQSGRFYCEAHNQHGSQRSDAVTVTVHPGADRNVIVIAATSGGLFIIIIFILFIM